MEIVVFVLKMIGIGAAKKAGEKIAEPIIEKIQPLFNAVRNKFKQKQIEGVLNNLEQDFSEENQDMFKTLLAKQMSSDENFAKEVTEIVQNLQQDEEVQKVISEVRFMKNIEGKKGVTTRRVEFKSKADKIDAISDISRESRNELESLNLIPPSNPDDEWTDLKYRLHELIRDFFQDKFNHIEVQEQSKIKNKFFQGMFDQAQEILYRSDFTNPNLKIILDVILKAPDDDNEHNLLIEFLNSLFSQYYSVQQYLYDTGYLETAIDKLEEIKEYLESFDEPKAKVVITKMLGHGYYNNQNNDDDINKAIGYMMEARDIASEAESSSQNGRDTLMWQWYQIFLLDAVHNLSVKKNKNVPNWSYSQLEEEISRLLPDTLEDTQQSPQSEDWFFVLRSAHYWGHRGNQIVGKLEKVFENLENLSINNDWQNDCNNGIKYYTLASMLRAVSLKLSLPNEYEEENLASLFTPENIPYFPDWLRSWSQNIQIGETTNFEKLSSLAQGIGDIAHQYRGMAGNGKRYLS